MEHIETLGRDPDFERPIDPRRKAKRNLGWPLVMVGAVAVAAFLTWRSSHTPEAPPAPPIASTPAPATSPAAPATPHYPIEAAAAAADETPLPTLADSDAPLQDALAALFAGTPLDGALRARGVRSLVVTGTMTDICVLATVVGAFNREYRVTVVEDGVATLWPEIQRATLDIVRRAYGRVVPAKVVADEMAAW